MYESRILILYTHGTLFEHNRKFELGTNSLAEIIGRQERGGGGGGASATY